MKPLSPDSTVNIEHDGVVFTISCALPIKVRNQIRDYAGKCIDEKGTISNEATHDYFSFLVKQGLKLFKGEILGFDNVPIVMNGEGVTDDILKVFSEIRDVPEGDNLVSFLGRKISEANQLSPDDKKK